MISDMDLSLAEWMTRCCLWCFSSIHWYDHQGRVNMWQCERKLYIDCTDSESLYIMNSIERDRDSIWFFVVV